MEMKMLCGNAGVSVSIAVEIGKCEWMSYSVFPISKACAPLSNRYTRFSFMHFHLHHNPFLFTWRGGAVWAPLSHRPKRGSLRKCSVSVPWELEFIFFGYHLLNYWFFLCANIVSLELLSSIFWSFHPDREQTLRCPRSVVTNRIKLICLQSTLFSR